MQGARGLGFLRDWEDCGREGGWEGGWEGGREGGLRDWEPDAARWKLQQPGLGRGAHLRKYGVLGFQGLGL